jgi:putative redox protein
MPASKANAETVVVSETGAGKFQVEVKVGGATFFADEPVAVGGLGSGPNPYDLLSAALGACTTMTIRLYANRKNWPLKQARVSVTHTRSSLQARDVFHRDIHLEGPLDDAQRAGLIAIAERCPVHVTLQRGSDITTQLVPDAMADRSGETGAGHMTTMEEAGEPAVPRD